MKGEGYEERRIRSGKGMIETVPEKQDKKARQESKTKMGLLTRLP